MREEGKFMEVQPEGAINSETPKREVVSLSSGLGGILAVKAGMTQVQGEHGEMLAVTVLQLRPVMITQVKSPEKEGYAGVQVGFLEKKKKSVSLSERGRLKEIRSEEEGGFYHYQEFRLPKEASLEGLVPGKLLGPGFVKVGDCVDLSAVNKGKGYQGGVKRYHMAGGYKTHGASLSHRQLGSIGNRADPAKCFKNKKMPGQMGNQHVTVQNVKVIGLDPERQLLWVHGSVPGPKGGIVTVRRTVKGGEQS